MADSAPDLLPDELDNGWRSVKRSRTGFVIALVLVAMIIALILLDHRSTPCHEQITRIPGTAANVEQCTN